VPNSLPGVGDGLADTLTCTDRGTSEHESGIIISQLVMGCTWSRVQNFGGHVWLQAHWTECSARPNLLTAFSNAAAH